jgi:YaiO family outer membrane protein
MLRRVHCLMALPWILSAQDVPAPVEPSTFPTATRVAVGFHVQEPSEGLGSQKGWLVEGQFYPARGGPWEAAAVGVDRPEGRGTWLSLGKSLLFRQGSSVYLGLGVGTHDAILPRWRADLEVWLHLGRGWQVEGVGALTRYSQEEVQMVQLGPGYRAEGWRLSVRFQQVVYKDIPASDNAGVLDLHLGPTDFGRWHHLRLAAGRGVLDRSLTSGSPFAMSTLSAPGGGRRRGSSTTADLPLATLSLPSAQERVASLTSHWPLSGTMALKSEVMWGEAVAAYRVWGGSLQVVVTF